MYYFTSDTIEQANKQISALDAKVGGLLCILHCLSENIEENISYTIDGKRLRSQLSLVFDKEPKGSFENVKSSYIIFARDWVESFFKRYIKNKVDLLACSVFFLRRHGFEKECTEEEVIDTFIKCFNLQQYRERWFCDGQKVSLMYNQGEVEDNQTEFYLKMNYTNDFKSILFNGVIQKSAADLKAAGQIQTLYSGSGVQCCFLLSDEPLDPYYIMSNSERNMTKTEASGVHDSPFARNRIIFGAPGTGKSYTLNKEAKNLMEDGGYVERVTFHPDYSYANFVGTYKPVMVKGIADAIDGKSKEVVSVLADKTKSAQEKYDLLYERFKDDGLTRLPILLGLYTDEVFKTRKQDGTDAVGDNSVERNHGKALRPYVALPPDVKEKEEIAYEYVPGPFMRVLAKALKSAMTDNSKPHLLIIEEINRANVAAVFGDVFQLLDRAETNVSEYEIATTNEMRAYLAKELGVDKSTVETIKIPDNMFLWATMNSADQGVFPMDTAFKRRWDFTYLGINDSEKDLIGNTVVLGTGKTKHKVEWNKLRKAINNFLAKEKINEDKQLGPYFIARNIVVPEEGTDIDNERFIHTFKSKVIMYLFEDAAKQKRSKLFEGCFENSSRYSEICREFEKKGIGIFHHDIQLEAEPEDLADASPVGGE